ncbi:transposase [Streptomyces chartreusis]|uniref:transposase n=1 Tax=Streptomyces chartreusis TaxID=1969 RepID=UPI0038208C48
MTYENETREPAVRERRYPSDTTDAEWAVLEPLLPVPACELPTGGRPEKHPRRNVVDAIRYVNDNGIKWRAVPVDFGIPWRTVYGFFKGGGRVGTWPASMPSCTRWSVFTTASIPALLR